MEVRPSIVGTTAETYPSTAHDAPVTADDVPTRHGQFTPRYSNSVVRVAAEVGLAVMVMRDGMDGETRFQYPAEKVVEEYRSHASQEAEPADRPNPTVSGETVPAEEPAAAPDHTTVTA